MSEEKKSIEQKINTDKLYELFKKVPGDYGKIYYGISVF